MASHDHPAIAPLSRQHSPTNIGEMPLKRAPFAGPGNGCALLRDCDARLSPSSGPPPSATTPRTTAQATPAVATDDHRENHTHPRTTYWRPSTVIPRTDWNLSSLATELGIDRRTLAKRLAGLEPVSTKTVGRKTERSYTLASVISHLADSGGDLDLAQERAQLARLQQEKLRIELGELRGELVRVPLVEVHWQAMIAAMRARLVGLPSKIAPQVSGPDGVAHAQDLIQTGVYEALAEIAGDAFPDDVRRRIEANASATP